MAATVESLARQVQAIRARVGRPGDPKHWVFMMPEGREIPDCIKLQMGPHDTAFIKQVMPMLFYNMFGEDDPGSCTVITSRGNFIVDMVEGGWTAVSQSVPHVRRR